MRQSTEGYPRREHTDIVDETHRQIQLYRQTQTQKYRQKHHNERFRQREARVQRKVNKLNRDTQKNIKHKYSDTCTQITKWERV